MKFSTRRKLVRRFWQTRDRIDDALWRVIKIVGEPRRHGFMWCVAALFSTNCFVCLFWRGLVLGALPALIFGFLLGRMF